MPILRVATDAEKHARDALTYAEWGPLLTLDQFREREHRLRSQAWAHEGMTTFFWCEGDTVLASCEAFRMESVLQGAAGPQHGRSYGIASVFTAPALRGHGHATRMMQALIHELRERDSGAQASILFSDVGPAIYEHAGYRARPCEDWVAPAERIDARPDTWLTERDLERVAPELPLPEHPFAVVVSAGQLDWHVERERSYAQLLGLPRPAFCGARVGRGVGIWTARYSGTELLFLWLSGTPNERAAVVAAARRLAFDAGMKRVRGWLSPGEDAPEGTRVQPRPDSLPMLCPLTAGVDASMWGSIPRALWE